jgi:ribosome-associated protein
LKPEKLSEIAAQSAREKKAHDITILDLRRLSVLTDFFVICSGESDLHVKAIATQIEDDIEKEGEGPWHVEGYTHANWILLDYVDVVVHVFHHKIREYYALERLWGDAPTTTVD